MGDRAGATLERLRHQARRYRGTLRWYVATLWRKFRWRFVAVVAAMQAGVAVIGAGLGLALTYAQRLEEDGQLQVLGMVRPARDEATLALVAAGLLVVLLAGTAILFWAQRTAVHLAVDLGNHLRLDVALAYGGEMPLPTDWRSDQAMIKALRSLQVNDTRKTVLATRNTLRNLMHLGIAVFGIGALFYLDASATGWVLGALLLALVAYYRVNLASVRATRDYETQLPKAKKAVWQLLPALGPASQPQLRRADFKGFLAKKAVKRETRAFRDRFRAQVYTELFSYGMMAIVLAGLMAYMGRAALADEMSWTLIVAYLVLLRLALGGVRNTFQAVAFLSRFYPAMARLHRYLSASNSGTSQGRIDAIPLKGVKGALVERHDLTGPIPTGETVGVVLPVALSRYSIGLLAQTFAGRTKQRRRELLGHVTIAAPLATPPSAISLRQMLLLDDDWDADALRSRLGEHAAAVEGTIGLDPAAPVAPDDWELLPPEAAARLSLFAAEASDRPILAVDRSLECEAWLRSARSALASKIVLLCGVGPPPTEPGAATCRHLVISPEAKLVAIGSPAWVAERWADIAERGGLPEEIPVATDDLLDDEDDEG